MRVVDRRVGEIVPRAEPEDGVGGLSVGTF
jgi:hypothetical protein